MPLSPRALRCAARLALSLALTAALALALAPTLSRLIAAGSPMLGALCSAGERSGSDPTPAGVPALDACALCVLAQHAAAPPVAPAAVLPDVAPATLAAPLPARPPVAIVAAAAWPRAPPRG